MNRGRWVTTFSALWQVYIGQKGNPAIEVVFGPLAGGPPSSQWNKRWLLFEGSFDAADAQFVINDWSPTNIG